MCILEVIDVTLQNPNSPAPSTVRGRYRDGRNYCDWCGNLIDMIGRRRHCSEECVSEDYADANACDDLRRIERLRWTLSNWRRRLRRAA